MPGDRMDGLRRECGGEVRMRGDAVDNFL